VSLEFEQNHEKKTACCVRVTGDVLSLSGALEMHQAMKDLWAQGCQSVLMDMSGVQACDASAVAVLVQGLRWQEQTAGSRFRLRSVSASLENLLHVMKLDDVFEYETDA